MSQTSDRWTIISLKLVDCCHRRTTRTPWTSFMSHWQVSKRHRHLHCLFTCLCFYFAFAHPVRHYLFSCFLLLRLSVGVDTLKTMQHFVTRCIAIFADRNTFTDGPLSLRVQVLEFVARHCSDRVRENIPILLSSAYSSTNYSPQPCD